MTSVAPCSAEVRFSGVSAAIEGTDVANTPRPVTTVRRSTIEISWNDPEPARRASLSPQASVRSCRHTTPGTGHVWPGAGDDVFRVIMTCPRCRLGCATQRDGGSELTYPVLIARASLEPSVGLPATAPIARHPTQRSGAAGRRVTLPLLSPPWRTYLSTRSRSDLGADRRCSPADGCWRRSTSRHPL